MPVLIMMNKSYNDNQALANVVNYVTKGGCGLCGGIGVDTLHAVEQMQQVKVFWGKDHGRRIRHFILSFKKSETIAYVQLMRLGFEICKYYSDYQSVYGLHTDTDHRHLHFAVNTVSYKGGKMYAGGLSDWYRLQGYIQGLLPQWYVDLRVSNGERD